MTHPRFDLTLEFAGDEAGAIRALRAALKVLLRAFGLRCIRVVGAL